jgi:peptidoglycan/LPS O-acetylase OafA/YrhL
MAAQPGFDLLLVIRGLAALSVVVWHVEGYKAALPPVFNTPGRVAVWTFFGISGYVIAYGFIRGRYLLRLPDLRDFYTNRILRIYPLFVALSLLAWGTALAASGQNPLALSDVPAQFFAVQFNHAYILSGVFWTLGVELQFYLLAPLLVLLLFVKGWMQVVVAAAVYVAMIAGIGYAAARHGWSFDGRNIVSNLPHFFMGMMACRLAWSSRQVRVPAVISLPLACGLIGLASWVYHRQPGVFWSVWGIVLVDAAVCLFILAHARLARLPRPAGVVYATFAWLGTISYGIYAWHAYLITSVPWLADHLFPVIALSLAAADLSFRLVETPALRLKRHPKDSHGAARPAEAVPA